MQEDIENRAVTLIISTTKFSGRTLKAAIVKLMQQMEKDAAKRKQKDTTPHGKQTVKQLIGQDAGASNIEATNLRVRSFDRVARKYGVDYAIQKDSSSTVPKYLIFFKGRDADALTSAFKEYSAKEIRKETARDGKKELERPSILAKLRRFTELVRTAKRDPVKVKDKGLEL